MKKKEKIIYIDDGSTVVDMSGLRQTKKPLTPDVHGYGTPNKRQKQPSRWRSIVGTYFDSMKMMLLPMLAFIGIIAVAFFFLWLIFYLKTL
ncbi:MAG: hypothetical protein IKJ35_08800 [Clostridia bacterium]|nr:hypothetical protein [Clostridia bacterium]